MYEIAHQGVKTNEESFKSMDLFNLYFDNSLTLFAFVNQPRGIL